MRSTDHDIAIVGTGCFLPGAKTMAEFWSLLNEARAQFREMPESRFVKAAYVSGDATQVDRVSHRLAAYIDDSDYAQAAHSNGLDNSIFNRLQVMAVESTRQALASLKISVAERNTAVILGCGWLDEQSILVGFYEDAERIQAYLKKHGASQDQQRVVNAFFDRLKDRLQAYDDAIFSTSVIAQIRQTFAVSGEGFMVDAACASSLAAMQVAIKKLQSGACDVVISGGVDAYLSPELQQVFARTQTLATEGCWPFDARSDGLLQGEGAGIVVLQRLQDARRDGHTIEAVIKGVGATSNGHVDSLFASNRTAQVRAIRQAMVNYAAREDNALPWVYDYIECHGTGTQVGDRTEIEALEDVLSTQKPTEPVPIGSLKALIGHTKSAAGVSSVLKCVLMMKHRKIPPSTYWESSDLVHQHVHVSATVIDFSSRTSPLRMGVSAFGFGGANYHVLLEDSSGVSNLIPVDRGFQDQKSVLLLAEVHSPLSTMEVFKQQLKMPPSVFLQTDVLQLQALLCVQQALAQFSLPLKYFDRHKISVISASGLCINTMRYVAKRLRPQELKILPLIEGSPAESLLENYQNTYPSITEDTGAGSLNNVIAGRICHYFDFRGKNYNMDGDTNSLAVALNQAALELQSDDTEMVVVVASHDQRSNRGMHIARKGMSCYVLSRPDIAKQKGCVGVATMQTVTPACEEQSPPAFHQVVSSGIFFDHYLLNFMPFTAPQGRCLMFPGQGSAFPGMFANFYHGSERFSHYFSQADAFAEQMGLAKPSRYILEADSLSDQERPLIQNLCLYTCEVALADLMCQKIQPDVLTAHSFGEFAALVAAGIVSFDYMLAFVYFRELCSPPPLSLGQMIAVKADESTLSRLLIDHEVFVSNINSPTQTVISVTPEAQADVVVTLRNAGLGYQLLTVSQPYHSPLMQDVSDQLKRYVEQKPPQCLPAQTALWSSVLGRMCPKGRDVAADVRDILINQVTAPMDFEQQMRGLYQHGMRFFYEMGPGDLCRSFARQSIPQNACYFGSVEDFYAFELPVKTARVAHGKLVSLLNKVVRKVTGYEIHDIKMEDRFAEDLGIDSIKKTEIVFRLLDEAKISREENVQIAQFEKLADVVDFLESPERQFAAGEEAVTSVNFSRYQWGMQRADWCLADVMTDRSHWPIKEYYFSDIVADAEDAVRQIQQQGEACRVVIIDDSAGSVQLENADFFVSYSAQCYQSMSQFCQKLATLAEPGCCLLLSGMSSGWFFEAFHAFLLSHQKEHNGWLIKYIKLDDFSVKKQVIERESLSFFETSITVSQGVRNVAVLRPVVNSPTADILPSAVMLVIGGLGGTAFSLLSRLLDEVPLRVCLLGRSELDGERQQRLGFLQQKAPVNYRVVDACDAQALEQVIQTVVKEFGKIDFLINAAGVDHSGLLAKKEWSDIQVEYRNKLLPAYYSRQLQRRYPIRQIIHFGSIVAHFGNAGQTVYASANAVVNALTEAQGVALNWPPWQAVGMTARQGIHYALKQQRLALLDEANAYPLFRQQLQSTDGVPAPLVWHPQEQQKYRHFSAEDGSGLLGEWCPPVFSKPLRLADNPHLQDHAVKGVIYVPAALAITLMLYRFRLEYGRFVVVEDFQVLSGAILSQDITLNTLLTVSEDYSSCQISTERPQFVADSRGEWVQESKHIEWSDCSLAKETVYGVDGLFHGPAFQCLDQVRINADNTRLMATMKTPAWLSEDPMWVQNRLMLWLDGALQALGLLLSEQTGQWRLPVSIKRIVPCFPSEQPTVLRWLAEVSLPHAQKPYAQVILVDEQYRPLLRFDGIEFR